MHQARSIGANDFASDCPVPLDLIARLMRAGPDAVAEAIACLSGPTRARLAVYLYGRSHTHELGICIAATCDANLLRRVAGIVGTTLHDLSLKPYEAPSHGIARSLSRRISLGGPRIAA